MPDFAHNPKTGQVIIRDKDSGDWRPATDNEVAVASDPIAAAVLGFLVGATPLPVSMVAGIDGAEKLNAINEVFPGAETAGAVTAIAGGTTFGALRAFGAGKAGGAAVGSIAQTGAKRLDNTVAAELDKRIAAANVSPFPGAAGSVGAAQAAGAEVRQAGRSARIIDSLFEPRPLTTDQARIIASGRPASVGFRFLPGQTNGQNFLIAGAKSDPIIGQAFDPVFTGNRQQLNKFARRAVGLEDGAEFGRAELGKAADDIGSGLDDIGAKIPTMRLPNELVEAVNKLKKVEPDLALAAGEETAKVVSGDQLMAMRSLLGKVSRQSWRSGQILRAEAADAVVKNIDTQIAKSLSAADIADFSRLREQWRFLVSLEKPGSFKDSIGISPTSLANRFRQDFKGQFARRTFADPKGPVSEAGRDLLDFTKISSAFADNVGDSGTATRLGLQNLLRSGGIKDLARRIGLRGALSQLVKNEAP